MNSPPLSPIPLLPSSPYESPNQCSKRKPPTSDVNCASCGLVTSIPISCSGCYDYFCDICINLLERKCPRCEMKPAPSSPKMPPKCQVHDKELFFFCLTCEKETCSECILDAKDHKRHTFDRLEAVYLEKVAITEDKLGKIELQIEELEKYTKVAMQNMVLINATEDTIMADLQTLFDAAKNEVNEIVDAKREELKKRVHLPMERRAAMKQIRDEIKAIGHLNFIKQQDRFNAECDKLEEQFKAFSADLIDHYDIGCELVPATKMTTFSVECVDGKREVLNVKIDDSTGETWKMSVIKGDLLCLRVAPNENVLLITSHKFKVTTEIAHSDISKSLRKRFVIQRKMAQFELASVDQLSSGGYLKSGTMILHIAIEPLNVVEAYDHYKEKVVMLKKSVDHYNNLLNASKESYDSMKKDIDSLKNFSVGYFFLDYSNIQKQAKSGFVSPNISDFNGNEWKMEIKFDRDENNKIQLSAYIFPARIITTCENSRRCAYFIELMHSNSDEIIRGYAENLFDESGLGRGWKGFVERMRILNDVGFVRNGKIWFRYGVRPTA